MGSAFLPLGNLGVFPVATRVIGGGVVAETIGHRLDEGRSAATTCAIQRLGSRDIDREDIVPIHLQTWDAVCVGFLSEGLGSGLSVQRDRDRPLVVLDHEDAVGLEDPGAVHGFVEVTLRCRAVAAKSHRGRFLATQLQ